jgi:predicted transcriptional regulator
MNVSEKNKDSKKSGRYEWRYRPNFDSALERLPTEQMNNIKRKFKKRARQRVKQELRNYE